MSLLSSLNDIKDVMNAMAILKSHREDSAEMTFSEKLLAFWRNFTFLQVFREGQELYPGIISDDEIDGLPFDLDTDKAIELIARLNEHIGEKSG